MATSLRARVVYCVDRPPIDDGVVTIEGEWIVAIGTSPEPGATVRDLGDVALLPAFVNAHTHLEFSHLEQPLGRPGMRLIDWLPLAIAERQNRSQSVADSIAAGRNESVATGTCAIGEIATAEETDYKSQTPDDLTLLFEVIGFSRARAASALQAFEERFGTFHKSHVAGISPHAPYTVSPSLLRMLVLFAQRHDLPVAMHIAESEEELQLLESASGPFQELLEARSMWDPTAIPAGTRPLTYLRMLADAPRSLVIHGNYLDHEEYRYLADHADHMSLVYCPRTHAYFAHPSYPLNALLTGGVRVALGTDSRASNPDLNMLGEMQHVARTHADVPPEAILRMGTLSSAEALGVMDGCGSITTGKRANIIGVVLPANCPGHNADHLSAIFHDPAASSRLMWVAHSGRQQLS